jgi:nitroreductase
MFDPGGVASAMMLAAWERGIGSVPATVYDQSRARELLGHPPGQHCEYLLSFGYPADPGDMTRPPRSGGRRPIDQLVHDERW